MEVNWDAIGAIGEIVGAIAVIATLVYLSLQVRQNEKTTAASSMSHSSDTATTLQLHLAEPDNAALLMRGSRSYEALEAEEKFRYTLLMRASFNWYENAHAQAKTNDISRDYWQSRRETTLVWLFENPGVKSYWEEDKEFYGREFREAVDEIVSEQTGI